jgi:hypothetical protein
MTHGYIYCFSNVSMPGILKIGMTTRTPLDRLSEANSPNTWIPTPFKIEFAKKVYNVRQKEQTLHLLLEQYSERVNPRREFFRVSPEEVFRFFELMDGEVWYENTEECSESEKEHDNVVEDTEEEEVSLPKAKLLSSTETRDVTRVRNTKNRPTYSELFVCFNTTTELRLRYGKHTFKGIIYKGKQNKIMVISPETQEEEEVRSFGSWVSLARDGWLKTTSNKNAYEVIDYKNIETNEWVSLIDITPESRYN